MAKVELLKRLEQAEGSVLHEAYLAVWWLWRFLTLEFGESGGDGVELGTGVVVDVILVA